MTGRNVIRVRLHDGASAPLVLDFDAPPTAVTALTVNGQSLRPDVTPGHIVVPAAALVDGDNVVDVRFVAGDGPLNRADDFLYTLFVPARAHRAFPCFDQPDLKARVSLTLDIPAAGMPSRTAPSAPARSGTDARLISFAETAPLLDLPDGVRGRRDAGGDGRARRPHDPRSSIARPTPRS